MEFDALIKLLASVNDSSSHALVEDFRSGKVRAIQPGPARGTAKDVGATFGLRVATTRAAGIAAPGLVATVERLQSMDPDSPVLLFHLSGKSRTYSVFVSEVGAQVIGIVVLAGVDAPPI